MNIIITSFLSPANRFIAPNGVADRSSVYFQNQR